MQLDPNFRYQDRGERIVQHVGPESADSIAEDDALLVDLTVRITKGALKFLASAGLVHHAGRVLDAYARDQRAILLSRVSNAS